LIAQAAMSQENKLSEKKAKKISQIQTKLRFLIETELKKTYKFSPDLF